jgi:hypothetical protein
MLISEAVSVAHSGVIGNRRRTSGERRAILGALSFAA